MIKKTIMLFVIILLVSQISIADDITYNVKELKQAGKISSLEIILLRLSKYNIQRLLEVELKKNNKQYIYELEYIDDKGVIWEIEVDALSAQMLNIEHEN